MTALFPATYRIRATEALTERLFDAPDDLRELLSATVVWSHAEPSSDVGRPADRRTVKLVFLARLRDEWVVRPSAPDSAPLVAELLGPTPIDEAVFDRWWSLERIPASDESVESVLDGLDAAALACLALREDEPLSGVIAWRREEEELLALALPRLLMRIAVSGAPAPYFVSLRGYRPPSEALLERIRPKLDVRSTPEEKGGTSVVLGSVDRLVTPAGTEVRLTFRHKPALEPGAGGREVLRFRKQDGRWNAAED